MWELTPREWYRELIAYRDREVATVNRDITVAWMMANFNRATKFPELKTLLVAQHTEPPRQTVAQMKTTLQLISEHYGIPLRKGKAKFDG